MLSRNELGAGAWSSRAIEVGARPMREQERDPCKHLTFLLVYFLVSSSCCGDALQLHEEGDGNNIVTFFFFFVFFIV